VSRIFLSAPDVRHLEREYVMDAIDSNWVAPAGPHLDAFEKDLAEASGRAHAVAVASGTAALHLALLQAGVGPGDEVLCSSLTFIGSASPILYCGATPVFIDSEPDTWNMDPDLLRSELERRAASSTLPKAAVVVDLYGMCAQYATIMATLAEFNIALIEDAAEALGARCPSGVGGSFGESAILSFNGNKIITSSGGGALVTDDPAIAERARYLATQARQPAVHYEHTEIGYNYRLSNICAALGLAQLHTLGDRVKRRREIHGRYRAVLADFDGVALTEAPPGWEANYWLTCATFTEANSRGESPQERRDNLISALGAEDIESRPVWKPMHMQPVFSECSVVENGVGERLFETGLCLPTGSGMTDDDIDRIEESMRAHLEQTA